MRTADVVIAGELHDNADHHLAQAWIVEAVRPAGLAFEMIPKGSEEGIEVFLEEGGEPGEIGPAIGWERNGWPDWGIYRPIFEAWTAEVYKGGALPRAEVRRAVKDGALPSAVEAEVDYPLLDILSEPLDGDTQSAMEEVMVASHCGHLPRPCRRRDGRGPAVARCSFG